MVVLVKMERHFIFKAIEYNQMIIITIHRLATRRVKVTVMLVCVVFKCKETWNMHIYCIKLKNKLYHGLDIKASQMSQVKTFFL